MKNPKHLQLLVVAFVFVLAIPSFGQRRKKKKEAEVPTLSYDSKLYQAMKWRNVGPFRGGRSTAVTGVNQDIYTYYMGTTGGGLWKTTDGGAIWRNVSDGFFKTGSVGAVDVSDSDPNVLFVGMGEAPIRGVMSSHGDGVYRSTDAGKTWEHKGLDRVRQISRVRIHPTNPDFVYVSAQGSPYVPTEDRGIYRSKDGGENWEKVLFVDSRSGACDLSMDASNPRILYAAFWDHQRLPWKMVSGGPGSSIWKSTDGGDTWAKLEKGLPDVTMGKIGVAVSPANPNKVYAVIESEKGGLYRSDDAGKSWKLINKDRILRARSWYYMHMFAAPQNPDHIVVLNAPFLESWDGGKTFQQIPVPHGDNHDLWFNPGQPHILINANDGGSNISYNGGKTWSTQSNQPTAQFYRINADNRFPYYLYAGQQDNSTVVIPNRTFSNGIKNEDFYRVGGCESAYNAFDPDNPRFVYSGCYQGIIDQYDTELKISKDIMAYPFLGLGSNPKDLKYRFNWNAPILISKHDKSVMYHAGNKLLKSTDKGLSWTEISSDLSRNDPAKNDWGGGPITNEAAGGENYQTIYYVAESHQDPRTIWAGTDDGLLHITRDAGETWTNISPPNLQEGMINCIETSPSQDGKAYVAFNRYKFNDFTPYIFITEDYGTTWKLKTEGIEEEAHVRAVREDPLRKGLLYAGTETGLYISFDAGNSWEKFQLNLPIVPITDIKVHHGDLLLSTQGRAFWILDDLGPLHQLNETIAQSNFHVYKPRNPYLVGGVRVDSLPTMGTNPDNGLVAYYYLKEKHDSLEVKISVFDAEGAMLREYSSGAKEKAKKTSKKEGMNKFVWNLSLPAYESPKGLFTLGGNSSYRVGPGAYSVKVVYGADSMTHNFEVLPDPRQSVRPSQYQEQQATLRELGTAISDLYKTVKDLRHVKGQINSFVKREDCTEEIKELGKGIVSEIDSLENGLVQNKQKTFQDVINYPNQLNAKLLHIQSTIAGSPPPLTQGQKLRAKDMLTEWAGKKSQANQLLETSVAEINAKIQQLGVPFISGKQPKEGS